MGDIRSSVPSENLGFPFPVCKKIFLLYVCSVRDLFWNRKDETKIKLTVKQLLRLRLEVQVTIKEFWKFLFTNNIFR